MTTSGIGLGKKKIENLRAFAQVSVSYDGPGEAYADVRGFEGANAAGSAIERARRGRRRRRERGAHAQHVRSSAEAVRRAASSGAKEVSSFATKPQGRARSLDYFAKRLTPNNPTASARCFAPRARVRRPRSHSYRLRARCPFVGRSGATTSPSPCSLGRSRLRSGLEPCRHASMGTSRRAASLPPRRSTSRTSRAVGETSPASPPSASMPMHRPKPCASCNARSFGLPWRLQGRDRVTSTDRSAPIANVLA